MQIPQTTYNDLHVALKNGQASESALREKWSRIAKAPVTVGAFCLLGDNGPAGASPGQCKPIPDATATLGASCVAVLLDEARSPMNTATATSGNGGQYLAGDDVPLLRKGEMGMYSETAWTQGNPVYVRCTAAGANGERPDPRRRGRQLRSASDRGVHVDHGGAGIALVEVK
jgi:hypothetical protein